MLKDLIAPITMRIVLAIWFGFALAQLIRVVPLEIKVVLAGLITFGVPIYVLTMLYRRMRFYIRLRRLPPPPTSTFTPHQPNRSWR